MYDVYRTLDLLSRLGFVRRIHTEEGCHGRASARLGHRHHLICRQCGDRELAEEITHAAFVANGRVAP